MKLNSSSDQAPSIFLKKLPVLLLYLLWGLIIFVGYKALKQKEA